MWRGDQIRQGSVLPGSALLDRQEEVITLMPEMPPAWVSCRLIKLKTDDHMVEMLPEIPLGKVYRVNLNSIREQTYYNAEFNRQHVKQIINTDEGGWLATELLEFLTN